MWLGQLHVLSASGAVQGDHLTACVFPPKGDIPYPVGPAFRENLGMKIVSVNVDGPKKVLFPKTPEEMKKNHVSPVTHTHNLLLDMYSRFQEKKPEAIA